MELGTHQKVKQHKILQLRIYIMYQVGCSPVSRKSQTIIFSHFWPAISTILRWDRGTGGCILVLFYAHTMAPVLDEDYHKATFFSENQDFTEMLRRWVVVSIFSPHNVGKMNPFWRFFQGVDETTRP